MFRGRPDKFVPIFFDEAGHRVATQYLISTLHGHLDANHLKNYRKGHAGLPGHPELGATPGVQFSSGRLGHMWPYVNGVAMANPDKICICLGSDGSQMEGNDAEAARLAMACGLNVKLFIDDNDVTIAGHPTEYMKGYTVEGTLAGHGLATDTITGEPECDIETLYASMQKAMTSSGPYAVVHKRKMAPGIEGIEGDCHGHDAIAVNKGVKYFETRGNTDAIAQINGMEKAKPEPYEYKGTSDKKAACRRVFGTKMAAILSAIPEATRKETVMVIDCDLEGSTGLNTIAKAVPDVYVKGGIMERGNFSAAAGFGMAKGKQGIFSTFAAFLEMCISEITMARLNNSNVLCHFSHSGCDDMADNTCHFGLNNFFADNGLEDGYDTKLYFPADTNQLEAMLDTVYPMPGLRFVFTTRSSCPMVLDDKGEEFYGNGYKYEVGKDDIIRKGTAGYVVTFGDALYRALDAVDRLRAEGIDVGLVNKSTLNVIDEAALKEVGSTGFVVVVESFSKRNGLGIRFGSWLLEAGYSPKFARLGTHHEGSGGLFEHYPHQKIDSASVQAQIKSMV